MMETIAGCVKRHKALSIFNSVQQRGFPLQTHWRLFVGAGVKKDPAGEEDEDVILVDVFRGENSSILCANDIKAVLLAQFGKDLFRMAKLVWRRTFYDAVFIPCGHRKIENALAFSFFPASRTTG